jgi:hypothetical protein
MKYIHRKYLSKILILIGHGVSRDECSLLLTRLADSGCIPADTIEIIRYITTPQTSEIVDIDIVSELMDEELEKLCITRDTRREGDIASLHPTTRFRESLIDEDSERIIREVHRPR